MFERSGGPWPTDRLRPYDLVIHDREEVCQFLDRALVTPEQHRPCRRSGCFQVWALLCLCCSVAWVVRPRPSWSVTVLSGMDTCDKWSEISVLVGVPATAYVFDDHADRPLSQNTVQPIERCLGRCTVFNMASGSTPRRRTPGERWAAQVAVLKPGAPKPRTAREPLSARRIVDAALQLVQAEGFDALTMRRLASTLHATPGALYAHVQDKQELDDLMLGTLCARVQIPAPDPNAWKTQAIDVCAQLRDEYLRYPGIWRATLAAAPSTPDTMRIMEGLLAILTSGGVPLRYAAWAIDAAFQYTGAYSVTSPRRALGDSGAAAATTRDEVTAQLAMLPSEQFPISAAHAAELTSGEGHERFDFTLGLLFGGLPQGHGLDNEH